MKLWKSVFTLRLGVSLLLVRVDRSLCRCPVTLPFCGKDSPMLSFRLRLLLSAAWLEGVKQERIAWNHHGKMSRPHIYWAKSWFFFIVHCRVSLRGVAILLDFARDTEFDPGVSGNDDVPTGVETDGQLRWRRIDVIRNLVPMPGAPAWCPWGCPQSNSKPGSVGAGVQ